MNQQLHNINIYNQHVDEYVNKFMELDLYSDTFDYLLEMLPLKANVLDLGCGPGNVVKYLKSKRGDLQILGIDLAPRMIKEAEKQNPDSSFALMDIRNADQLKQKFGAVLAAFCLPYISYDDVAAFFRNIEGLTADNGILYLSCMEGARVRSGLEKTSFTGDSELYINYFERKDIELWLAEQHFSIEAFFTKDYPETDGSTTTDLIYIGKKYTIA